MQEYGQMSLFCTCISTPFFNVSFIFEGERQIMIRGGTGIEADTESRLWAVSTEPDVGLKPTNYDNNTWLEVGCLADWASQAPLVNTMFKRHNPFPTAHCWKSHGGFADCICTILHFGSVMSSTGLYASFHASSTLLELMYLCNIFRRKKCSPSSRFSPLHDFFFTSMCFVVTYELVYFSHSFKKKALVFSLR